ncbi:unnamed protein product [Chironomus riparius]|uniref:Transient receptor potential cation channel protein painless n=1 Tax=Chironomus riparius TaxID=315576 RepID=A0A9N9S0P0_9DIPT|nr:unnamed protein product [Chironomus riparius]
MSHACDLHKAFEEKSQKRFIEALEVFEVDPNATADNDPRTVFERILNTPDSAWYIEKCIEYGADFNVKNMNNEYPIHYLIKSLCIKNLKAVERFLRIDESKVKASPYVNVKDIRDQNCLHIIAEKLNDENKDDIIELMCTLLSYGCNINSPNDDQETPFFIVVRELLKWENGQEVFDKLLASTTIDFHTHKGDEIIKMVKDKYIATIPEREKFVMCYEEMKKLLESGDINKFETLFSYYKPDSDQSFLDDCYSYLEIAVQKSYINIVDLLIKKRINFNRLPVANKANRITPPFLAYKNANVGIFKSFLLAKEHQKFPAQYRNIQCKSEYEIEFYCGENKDKTLLHQFFSNVKGNQSVKNCKTIKMSKNEKKCFKLLINDIRCDQDYLNALDEEGKPVIYYAVKYSVDYMTFKLLEKGAYIGHVVTKIRNSLLSDLLDSSITSNDEFHDSKEYEITANYGFLMPPIESCKDVRANSQGKDNISMHTFNGNSRKGSQEDLEQNNLTKTTQDVKKQQHLEMNVIKSLAEDYDYRQFVMHPVLSSFIFLKWKKIRFVLHVNLMTTLLFILTFIPYIMIDRYIKENKKVLESSNAEDGEIMKESEVVILINRIFLGLAFFSVFLMIVREACQFSLSKKSYFLSISNWMDLILIIASLIFLFTEIELPILQTLIIILATSECFHRFGYLPYLSVSLHAKIFRKVLGTFLKSLAFFSIMIVGFMLASYTLYRENIARLMSTTLIMNITKAELTSRKVIENPLEYIGVLGISASVDDNTYIGLCALILFIVALLLLNLLNALTVSDTQEIKSDSKLIDLCERISVMCNQENLYSGTGKINDLMHNAVSLFSETLTDGKICLKPNLTPEAMTSDGKAIKNYWLQSILCYFDRHMTMDSEILRNMRTLLVKKREDLIIKDYKERRFEKMVNDVLKLNEQKKSVK